MPVNNGCENSHSSQKLERSDEKELAIFHKLNFIEIRGLKQKRARQLRVCWAQGVFGQ